MGVVAYMQQSPPGTLVARGKNTTALCFIGGKKLALVGIFQYLKIHQRMKSSASGEVGHCPHLSLL